MKNNTLTTHLALLRLHQAPFKLWLSGCLAIALLGLASGAYSQTSNTQVKPKLANTPAIGAPVAAWMRNPAMMALYKKALGSSPANAPNSWVYKDAGLAQSTAIAGQNANTWVRLTTCASKNKLTECRLNHIDVFYDPAAGELYAYLSLGNRQGWLGAPRPPTNLEQKFFTQHLTRELLQ